MWLLERLEVDAPMDDREKRRFIVVLHRAALVIQAATKKLQTNHAPGAQLKWRMTIAKWNSDWAMFE